MRRRGFTLLELLVATSVLVILGSALVVVLRGGVTTWRRGEARRESFEVAQAVLGQLADDLQCATIDPRSSHGGGPVDSIFRGDQDDLGRSRIALVRTIRGESENPITGHAGSQIGGDSRIGYRDDLRNALDRRLRATGGLMEVAWVMGEKEHRTVLYRGVRTPVGGAMSFFTFDLSADRKSVQYHFFPAPLAGEPPAKTEPPEGASYCREFAREVVFFELLYATPYTSTWSTEEPPRRSLRDPSGPLTYWDSTRAVLQPPDNHKSDKFYKTWKSVGSLVDPADDVLPSRVKITIVVREAPAAESATFLRGDVTRTAPELTVYDPARLDARGGFVFVDDEWIEYDGLTGNKVHVKLRGARGTIPAAHVDGAEVVVGRTFEAVLPIPAAREDWGER